MSEPVTFDRGRYRDLRVLSRGGFGAVYDALDNQSGERVALKILTLTDTHREVAEEMVKREVAALEGFDHPAVARLLRHFEEREARCVGIVLALVPGGMSLEKLLQDAMSGAAELPPLRWRLEQLSQLLDALDRAHQRRVIHRDVKPANVLLDREELTLKLADFGVALVLESFGRGEKGRTLREFYTRPYAAPEQVLRQMATPASDLHAFGVLATCLLAGRLPGADFRQGDIRAFLEPAQQLMPDEAVFDRVAATLAQLVQDDPPLRPKAAEVSRVLREVTERTTRRPAVSLRLTQNAAAKARRAGLRDAKAIRQDLNSDLRVRYDSVHEGDRDVDFTLRLWGRTLYAVAKPTEPGSPRLVIVDAGANPPSMHHRQREDQLRAPFTLFLGEAEDADELIRFAYEDYISKRAAEEARALEESLFKLSERVLEQERERLQEILIRYELDVPERAGAAPPPETHPAPGPSEARKVPDEHETKTGQLLRFRVIETTIPIDVRSGPTEVPTDWHEDLIVDDDRFYIEDRELGTFYAFDPDAKILVLRVTKPMRIPGRGLLLHKDLGTERALDRQEDALAVFKRGAAVSPSLRRLLLFPQENRLGELRPRDLLQPLEPLDEVRDLNQTGVPPALPGWQ
jgi:serine/threonine protein kinase